MSKRTIVCKLAPTATMATALANTCETFAKACDYTLGLATEAQTSNNIKIHHLAYTSLRMQFGLSANLTVRAIRRVAASLTAAKRRGKKPQQFKSTSVDYDARIFDYRERDETVSLTTVIGRIHVPLILGNFQRTALKGKKPTAATLCRKGRDWTINIVIEESDATTPPGAGKLGIDLGIRNTATTSNGTLYSGQIRQQYKEIRQKIRASLQSKGTQGARNVLKRLSGRERRMIRYENHVLSRRIVEEAVNAHCGVLRMEELTGIRRRTKTWNKHLNRMIAGWSFGELQQFVEYKARKVGIAVEYVNPAYTSQTCPRCGSRGVRAQDAFYCTACEFPGHADLVAARNIAGGGVVNRPESRLCATSSHALLESCPL
jgi:IS605 OrfB family transposase